MVATEASRTAELRSPNRALLVGYVALVAAAAVGLVTQNLIANAAASEQPVLLWLGLALACFLAEHLRLRLHAGWLTTASTVPHLASAVLLPGGWAMLAGVIGALGYAASRREVPIRAVLNTASVALAVGSASWVLVWSGGLPLLLLGTWLGPLVGVAATLTYYLVSVICVAGAVSLDQRQPLLSLVRSKLGRRALAEVALGLLGVTTAIVLSTLPAWGLVLLVPAVLVFFGKRSSEALHRTEERLQRILASAQDAIVLVETDGRIVLFNAAAERMFGRSATAVLGQSLSALVPGWNQAQSGGLLEGNRASGERFPLEATLSRTGVGTEELCTLIVRDVSERQRAEAERTELLVREEAARAQAETAVRARDEFLRIAAHELRTPITTLHGYAQLLRGAVSGDDLDTALLARGLSQMEDQSLKLSRLVNELLDASRLEPGKIALEFHEMDLMQLVRGAVALAASNETSHKLLIDGPPTLWVEVDPLRVEQVLTNLIGNAIKFSPSEASIELDVRTGRGGMVELAVRDHGVGIPPERRARLFDRFYQAHGEGHLGGMGLGLYLSRQLVELHHGTLSVEFPSDGGTRFVARFPPRHEPEAGNQQQTDGQPRE